MRIENWVVIATVNNPYAAPETQRFSLQGEVFGHTRFKDGTSVTTSSIDGKNDKNEILTVSGSSYELGKVNPDYEQKFPDAKMRLLRDLRMKSWS